MLKLKNSKQVSIKKMIDRITSEDWLVFQYFNEINDLFSINVLEDLLNNYNDGLVETFNYYVSDESKTLYAIHKNKFKFTEKQVKNKLTDYVSLLIENKPNSIKGEVIIPHKYENNTERKYLFTKTSSHEVYVSKLKYLALFDGQNIMLLLIDSYSSSNSHWFENGNYRLV